MNAMDALTSWQLQIIMIGFALVIFKYTKPLVEAVSRTSPKKKKFGLWLVFVLIAAGGLMLGVGLYRTMRWLTGLGGIGEFVGSAGAIIAIWVGWHAFQLTVGAIKDIADGQPDEDARKAAKWVPTLLPPGIGAVIGIITEPRSLGVTITAAIMALISVVYCRKISDKALEAQKHEVPWKWFAAALHAVAGLIMISLALYLDALLARYLPGAVMGLLRAFAGIFGIGLLIGALVDIFLDKNGLVPDKYVRAFAMYGVPLLALGGIAALGYLATGTGTGLEYIREGF